MSKGLEALQRLFDHNYGNDFYIKAEEDAETIEKELKDYNEIKEIAKHYNFEDLGHEVYKIDTDRKWQLKFDAGIVAIQEDYRKARALEIIKKKNVDITSLRCASSLEDYNRKENGFDPLTQEEYDLLKEVLL